MKIVGVLRAPVRSNKEKLFKLQRELIEKRVNDIGGTVVGYIERIGPPSKSLKQHVMIELEAKASYPDCDRLIFAEETDEFRVLRHTGSNLVKLSIISSFPKRQKLTRF